MPHDLNSFLQLTVLLFVAGAGGFIIARNGRGFQTIKSVILMTFLMAPFIGFLKYVMRDLVNYHVIWFASAMVLLVVGFTIGAMWDRAIIDGWKIGYRYKYKKGPA